MKANEIITVLNQFKDSSYQRILINGSWGIGKTSYVMKFKEDHLDACYISLFGKKDINSIIQELYFNIIENAPGGKLKKHLTTLSEKINTLDVSYWGLSLSVPLIANIHKSISKELGEKETYIVVFDDLERKHNDLGIEEIFGLLDSLSKINNIKTVLVAATGQLNDENAKTFNEYKEKAIDRTYTIEKYADEAPVNILGEQTWKVIGKLAENFKFNNLRTFEKTSLFIKEVIQIIGEDIFTDKFTRDDLYRMCFATIFFNIEHKSEFRLLDTKNGKRGNVYKKDENGVIEYLYEHILKSSLDNVMSKEVFHHILRWYETGTYSRENILKLIASINNYKHKPSNFYSSEQDIHKFIDHSNEYIRNLNGTESMGEIVSTLSNAFAWSEVLSVDFGISNEEILNMINKNLSKNIVIEKSLFENDCLVHCYTESEEAKNLIKSINEAIKVEYYDQLIKRIKDCFIQGTYDNYIYLRQLTDSIITIDKPIRGSLLKFIKDNQFFFPLPSGSITEEHWNWCRLINLLIREIEQHWEIENYYDDFKAYFYSSEIIKKDKMLHHRLKQLF
ncbi:P-loop NTPase fold protein [Peribacillus butanolivorans]|uniref:P-loop NTPase fold protein n=1 Tax=Peribacillus butanolivorans TaxID=421767 RepID=UPI00366BAC7D